MDAGYTERGDHEGRQATEGEKRCRKKGLFECARMFAADR